MPGVPLSIPAKLTDIFVTGLKNNLHSELDADIYISAFHQTSTLRFTFVIPKETLGIWVILQSQNVAFSLYLHILSWHRWRREGNGGSEKKEPHKRIEQATLALSG